MPPSYSEPATVLRGATVAVDVRRLARVLVMGGLAALAVLVAALFWVGGRHNSRITSLREDGVPVTATVSQCRGLMGGSGSNLVGYQCTGTFTMGGRRYEAALPGNSLEAAGSTVRLVSVPGDPSLLATPAAVGAERPSGIVFVLPAVLLVVLIGLSAAAVAWARAGYSGRRRPVRRAGAGAQVERTPA